MINFTPLARMAILGKGNKAIEAALEPESTQRHQLSLLLAHASRTQWGIEHGISPKMTYEEYAAAVPVRDYEYFRPWAMRMAQGEPDLLWPGVTKKFAQSSGTSGGKSKYVPITANGLRRNHYAGATASAALYLLRYPDSKIFSGRALILGGSFANEMHLPNVQMGDLSATLIKDVNPLVNLFRTPRKSIALMPDWQQKLPALVNAATRRNITNISGVPSWMLTVLKGCLKKAQEDALEKGEMLPATLCDVWPNLEVFFHGGISFEPYREEYANIMGPSMRYWQTYNASEGFFASQSEIGESSMMLLQNAGVFFEFVPLDEIDSEFPHALPAWQVQPGRTYALVISTCNGLWRYAIGDTVRIDSIDPVKISIAGRTHSFINAFGEELMVYNAEAAIAAAAAAHRCSVANYTAAPVYAASGNKGRHQWLIEWDTPPADAEAFAESLDLALQHENSDYQAKRTGGIFLDRLELISAPTGLFDKWLAETGKLGGQRKVPRLSNDRSLMDRLLQMMPSGNSN